MLLCSDWKSLCLPSSVLIPPSNRIHGGRIHSRRLESGVHGSGISQVAPNPPGNRSRGGIIRSRRLESGVHGSQCVNLHFN